MAHWKLTAARDGFAPCTSYHYKCFCLAGSQNRLSPALCLCWRQWGTVGQRGGRGANEIKVTHSGAVASNFSFWVSEETATDLWYKCFHTAWWYQMEVHTENLDRAFDHISASCAQLSWLSVQKIKMSLVNQCVCNWRTGFFFKAGSIFSFNFKEEFRVGRNLYSFGTGRG